MFTFGRDLTLIAIAAAVALGGVAALAAMAPPGAAGALGSVLWTWMIAVGSIRLIRVLHNHDRIQPAGLFMPWW